MGYYSEIKRKEATGLSPQSMLRERSQDHTLCDSIFYVECIGFVSLGKLIGTEGRSAVA